VTPTTSFHHVGVQTTDLANATAWYEDFFGCRPSWTLTTFSDLTHSRLPGIRRLTELAVGDVRVHLFERIGRAAISPRDSITQFQHVCLSVDNPEHLVTMRQHWIDLYDSGKYTFALDEPPTDVVVDSDGVQSFYAYDVNGLEFEFTYVPAGDAL